MSPVPDTPVSAWTRQPERPGRGRRLLPRAAISLLLSAAVFAGTDLAPLSSAGAQTPTATVSELAKTGLFRASAPMPKSATRTYRESPAAFAFLTKGLHLPLGTSHDLTGAKSGNGLRLTVAAPSVASMRLPKGISSPWGATATLTINPATNAETVSSSSASGSVTVTITHAASAKLASSDVNGRVTDRISVFKTTEVLTGRLTDKDGVAIIALSGYLPAPAAAAPDVVFAKGTKLTLAPDGRLAVAGAARLGPAGRSVVESVNGTVTDLANWSLNASSAGALAPKALLPGLRLPRSLSGTVSDSSGAVGYDLRGTAPATWPVLDGVKVRSGAVELSDRLPAGRMFTAPGVVNGTDWADVVGTVSLASAGTTLSTQGGVAFNLSTGAGLLNSDQTGGVPLRANGSKIVLSGTTLTGHLHLDSSFIAGSITGTGTVLLQPKGQGRVAADATVVITGGKLVVSFPLDLSHLGLAPAGSVGTVYTATGAVRNFAITASRATNLPAGLSVAFGPDTAPKAVRGPSVPMAGIEDFNTFEAGALFAITNKAVTSTKTTKSTTPSKTFTVSSAVVTFLKKLGLSVASSTLTGVLSGTTLTVSLPAPTSLPFTLPAGIPAPVFGPTTVTVNTSTKTLTLDATASVSTAHPLGATLQVVVMNASTTTFTKSTDLSATLDLTGVPFVAGATLKLEGSVSDKAGTVSASLTGTLESDLQIVGHVVLMQGALVTLASGSGLTVSGTLEVGTGNAAFDLVLAGSIKDLKNWTFSLSDPNAPMWQPVPSLTLTPTFAGSITDTDGTVRFDLATSNVNGTAPLTWDAGAGASLSVTHVELSNATPPSGVMCPDGVADGDVWVDLQGSFAFTPANLNLTAEGCIDITAQTFKITTAATGTLLPGNPLFNITSASLSATGDIMRKEFNVTASAMLQITAVNGQPTFPVGATFGTEGVIVGAQLPDLSSLGFTGSGAVYIASQKVDNFDPTTLGGTGNPFNLPAGLSVTLDYQLPANIVTAFNQIGIDLGPQSDAHAVATLSSSGFSIDLGISFGAETNGLKIIDTNGTALYLNSFDLGLTVGAHSQISLSGSAYFELPALIPGTVASHAEVTISGSFNFDSLTLNLGLSLSDWTNALGIDGLEIGDFAGQLGITFETGIPTPSLGLSADNITLPSSWATAIGMVPGTTISFDANINLDDPLLSFSIVGPPGQPALTPLALVSSNPSVVNSLVINQASLVLAPFGGITAAGDSVPAGISVIFDAVIANVPVHVDAAVGITPPSLNADVTVGSFSIGPVNIDNPMFHLHLNVTSGVQIGFSGGVSAGNYSLSANVSLALGNTDNGASISLAVTAGLPSWLEVSGMLSGSISADSNGVSVSASGSGYLIAGGNQLGPVNFSYDGSLSWSDVVNGFNQIAQFFQNAGTNIDEIIQVLQNLGDNQQGIVNVLNAVGIDPTTVVNDITTVFGLINNSYNYIWVNPSAAQLYVLDVSGGSQSPNAPVIDYSWNGGYNQQWALIPGPNGYEIVNRGSGQCLSVDNNSTDAGTPLVQYPCFGGTDQLWNFGTTGTYAHQGITSVSSGLNVDVQGASFFQGATIDQWYGNGGSNQYFWFSPGTN
jgi:hypothetical protein